MVTQIPERHPAQPRPIPAGIAVFARLLGVKRPTASEFSELGELLMVGDQVMDEVVAEMSSNGMRGSRILFEEALTRGIDAVDAPPPRMEQFFRSIEATPEWVDHDQLAQAAEVMQSGGADGLYIARDVALMGGYQFAGFNQTLLRTGALTKGSNSRFAETSRWALDVISEGGLRPLGRGYQSTIRVRFIHAMVRRHVKAMPDWDNDRWGLPINQTDMAATLVGSLVAPSIGVAGLGLVNNPREYQAISHLTRYVGWLIGVDEAYLPRSFGDAMRILAHTSAALSTPDETSKQLAAPMVDDPDQWHYASMVGVRRRVAKSQHLGIARAFLGRPALRQLGVDDSALPWYPPLVFGLNLVRSLAAQLPGGRARAACAGARRADAFLKTMSPTPVVIGKSSAIAAHGH